MRGQGVRDRQPGPHTGAYVLSRGLTGSAGGRPYVASPLLKQRFGLTAGRCLDEAVVVHPVRTCAGRGGTAARG